MAFAGIFQPFARLRWIRFGLLMSDGKFSRRFSVPQTTALAPVELFFYAFLDVVYGQLETTWFNLGNTIQIQIALKISANSVKAIRIQPASRLNSILNSIAWRRGGFAHCQAGKQRL